MNSNAACPEYVPSTAVAAYLFGQDLTAKDLHTMVTFASPFTHEWGNRRYHDYVFDVRGLEVLRVGNLRIGTNSGIIRDNAPNADEFFTTYDPCGNCDGDGCHLCNNEGTVAVQRRATKPKVGVMS